MRRSNFIHSLPMIFIFPRLSSAFLFLLSLVTPSLAASTEDQTSQVHSLLSGLPLYFVENQGQVDSRIGYYLNGKDTSVYFTEGGLTFVLREHEKNERREASLKPTLQNDTPHKQWVVKVDFIGARKGVHPEGEERTAAIMSYFKGDQDQCSGRLASRRMAKCGIATSGRGLIWNTAARGGS
jgi:hypothetical protein